MTSRRQTSLVAAAALALCALVSGLASAEPQGRIIGTVADFHGKYGLVVRDVRGRLAEVTLHQGTVIKPEGLRLERGMIVSIAGDAADRTFAAAEIVAPFEPSPFARRIAHQPGFDSPGDRPGHDQRGDRWGEYPDQFSVPQIRDLPNPH